MTAPLRGAPASLDALPPLPPTATTRDGQIINPADDVWVVRKRADGGDVLRFYWRELTNMSPRMLHLAKLLLASRLPNYAPSSSWNDFHALRRLADWAHRPTLEWADLDVDLASTFLQHGLDSSAIAGNDFARLRDLYRYGVTTLPHEHFSAKVLLQLEVLRAPGNAKGNAVRQGDPTKGHFTPPEIESILVALGEGRGTPEQRATVWLALDLGRNALQYTLLRNTDLHRESVVTPGSAPSHLYQVEVRRIKKRTTVDDTRRWPLSSPVGDLLWSLKKGGPNDPLLWWLDSNSPEQSLGSVMKVWARVARVQSHRTGSILHLNSRRFRVTMLTNAADEGASAEHLAMLADHTDLQNIGVYLDRSPLFLERIRDEVDAIYDPVVKRFMGTFATRDEIARRGVPEIPGVAAHVQMDLPGLGGCGSKTICRLAPPLTCYSCPSFIAFRDGPHEQVEQALAKAMREMNPRVGVQVANTLAAVREVVTVIQAERA